MKVERELKVLTVEGRASAGLGQYAQHTCCGAHANAHLFPIFIFREGEEGERGRQGEGEDWMQLKGVALRANRLLKKGEVVSIKYVGSGRTGHFQKVFDCSVLLVHGALQQRRLQNGAGMVQCDRSDGGEATSKGS